MVLGILGASPTDIDDLPDSQTGQVAGPRNYEHVMLQGLGVAPLRPSRASTLGHSRQALENQGGNSAQSPYVDTYAAWTLDGCVAQPESCTANATAKARATALVAFIVPPAS